MSNITLLRVNTGPQDVNLFRLGYASSFFKYRPWSVASDKVRDIVRNLYTENIGFGKRINIELPKVGLYVEDLKLRLKVSAITGNGVGTYARLCDYPFFSMIKSIKLNYVQYQVQQKNPAELYFENLRDHDIQHYPIFEALSNSGQTAAQRNTNALADQDIIGYLKPYWYGVNGHVPAISSLGQKLNFQIEFATKEDVIQTDYTLGATATITEIEPIIDIVNVIGSERQEAVSYTMTNVGRTFLIQDSQQSDYKVIPASLLATPKATIQLDAFTIPISEFYLTLQLQSDVETPYGKKLFELDPAILASVKTIILRNGAKEEIGHFTLPTKEFADHWQKHHHTQWRKPVGYFRYGECAGVKNTATGSLNPTNIERLELYIEFNGPIAAPLVANVVVFGYNWVNHQGGNVSKVYI